MRSTPSLRKRAVSSAVSAASLQPTVSVVSTAMLGYSRPFRGLESCGKNRSAIEEKWRACCFQVMPCSHLKRFWNSGIIRFLLTCHFV